MDEAVAGGSRSRASHAPGRPARAVSSSSGWPSIVASLAAGALLLRLSWDAGGYFPPAFLEAGAAAFVLAAVLVVAWRPRRPPPGAGLVAGGALAAFVAWTGVSAAWAPHPDAAVLDFARGAAYVGLFGLGLVAAGSGRHARVLVWAVLAVLAAVAGAGLVARLAPGLLEVPAQTIAPERLAHPLGYWNAYGALAAMAAVLAAGLAGDPRGPLAARAAAAGAAVPLAVAVYLSLSRGAWAALALGLVVLVALSAHRAALLASLAAVGGGAAVALISLQAFGDLVDDPAAASSAARAAYAGDLALLVGAVTVAQAVLAAGPRSASLRHAARGVLRPVAAALATLLAVAAVGGYVARTAQVEGRVAGELDRAGDFVTRQLDEFTATGTATAEGRERLQTVRGGRSELWRVALGGFSAQPLRGEGASSYAVRWARERRVDESVRDAHSLPLETLAELGLVGAALLAAFLGAVGTAAVRARRRPGALTRGQSAAVAAVMAVWAAHVAVDWGWEMPAVTGAALVLAAALFPEGRAGRRRTPPELKPQDGPRTAAPITRSM